MSDSTESLSAAHRWYDNAMALRAGRITVDKARAFNASLRTELGERAYESAKIAAMSFDSRNR